MTIFSLFFSSMLFFSLVAADRLSFVHQSTTGGFSPPFPHPLPTNKKAMAIVAKVGGRRGGGLGLGRYAHTH